MTILKRPQYRFAKAKTRHLGGRRRSFSRKRGISPAIGGVSGDKLGPEIVINGDFATADNWNFPGTNTGWSHEAGQAKCSGAQFAPSLLFNDATVEAGENYLVSYEVTERTAGSVQVSIGATSGPAISQVGSFSEVMTATSNTVVGFLADANFTGAVDNLSVRKVTFKSILPVTEGLLSHVIATDANTTLNGSNQITAIKSEFGPDFKNNNTPGTLYDVGNNRFSCVAGINSAAPIADPALQPNTDEWSAFLVVAYKADVTNSSDSRGIGYPDNSEGGPQSHNYGSICLDNSRVAVLRHGENGTTSVTSTAMPATGVGVIGMTRKKGGLIRGYVSWESAILEGTHTQTSTDLPFTNVYFSKGRYPVLHYMYEMVWYDRQLSDAEAQATVMSIFARYAGVNT